MQFQETPPQRNPLPVLLQSSAYGLFWGGIAGIGAHEVLANTPVSPVAGIAAFVAGLAVCLFEFSDFVIAFHSDTSAIARKTLDNASEHSHAGAALNSLGNLVGTGATAFLTYEGVHSLGGPELIAGGLALVSTLVPVAKLRSFSAVRNRS